MTFVDGCKDCIKEAVENGVMDFTMSSKDEGSLCPRHTIQDMLNKLEIRMRVCEERGDYTEANKLKIDRDKYKQALDTFHHREWKKKHKHTLTIVKGQERSNLQRLRKEWRRRFEEHAKFSQEQLRAAMSRHHEEIAKATEEIQNKNAKNPPAKLTLKLLELRRSEELLASKEHYAEATEIKTIADKIEIEEKKQKMERLSEMLANKIRYLEMKHRKELKILNVKLKQEMDTLKRKEMEAEEYLLHRTRLTTDSLQHAFILRQNQQEKTTPMLELGAQMATNNCLSTVAAFTAYANTSPSILADGSDRPTTAPVSQRRNRTPKTITRNLDPLKRPVTSQSSKSIPCGHCGSKCPKEFVSIPPVTGLQFIGTFCSWKCAKLWNRKRSPLQFRWIRDVLIDQAAGYLVSC